MTCSISECGRKVFGHGWCSRHYNRWRENGDPLVRKKIPFAARQYMHEVVIPFAEDSCLPWPYAKNTGGYGLIDVNGRQRIVPRYLCEIFHGPPPSPAHVTAHSCGKGHEGCCNSRHLSWKTSKENSADMLTHGTRQRGESHHQAKLSEADVRQIRELTGKMTMVKVGEMFGVCLQTIWSVQKRKIWAHLD